MTFAKAFIAFSSVLLFSSPFHMRMQTPRAKSSSVTRPKSSVTPANILQGDRQIDSPRRRESGIPNLDDARSYAQNTGGAWSARCVAFMLLCYLLGFVFTWWTGYLIPSGVAGSTLGFCLWTVSSSVLFLFHPNHPLSRQQREVNIRQNIAKNRQQGNKRYVWGKGRVGILD